MLLLLLLQLLVGTRNRSRSSSSLMPLILPTSPQLTTSQRPKTRRGDQADGAGSGVGVLESDCFDFGYGLLGLVGLAVVVVSYAAAAGGAVVPRCCCCCSPRHCNCHCHWDAGGGQGQRVRFRRRDGREFGPDVVLGAVAEEGVQV